MNGTNGGHLFQAGHPPELEESIRLQLGPGAREALAQAFGALDAAKQKILAAESTVMLNPAEAAAIVESLEASPDARVRGVVQCLRAALGVKS
ncbi:MAG: hypothetical protein JXR96_26980 [Deltaproteobacteria bacterium]|nr:hypothetical protein [Deltaproteobacteria bacterium]